MEGIFAETLKNQRLTKHIPIIMISANQDTEKITCEAGADDFDATDDLFIITTPPDQLYQVKEKLDQLGIKCEEADLQMIPKHYVACDAEAAKANMALIEWIEALDDVDSVYHNMKSPDEG